MAIATDAQKTQFDSMISSGDYSGGASFARALGFSNNEIADYVGTNAVKDSSGSAISRDTASRFLSGVNVSAPVTKPKAAVAPYKVNDYWLNSMDAETGQSTSLTQEQFLARIPTTDSDGNPLSGADRASMLAQYARSPGEDNPDSLSYVTPAAASRNPYVPKSAAASGLADQILAQGTSGSWSGEGWGTAVNNATAMGDILAGIGITDIKQFGKLSDGSFGNIVTGQAVSNTYGDRQTGDAFGGTYAGEGNTGFRAQFKEDGTPVFYTSGQSSNTLAGILQGSKILNLAANVGAGLFGPLGSAALQLAQGNSLGDAARAGLLNFAGRQLKDYISGTMSPGGVDYSLASGPGNGLASMGGAQGLQQSIAGNLDYMGGGQGLTTALGASATSVADAISGFGGVNPANLDYMGGGQGFTYQTPSGLVTSSGVLPTGGLTGNNNVLGAGGINTAASISGTVGDQVAALRPNYTGPSDGLFTGANPPTGYDAYGDDLGVYGSAINPVINTPGGALDFSVGGAAAAGGAESILSNLTTDQILNIVKAGISIAGIGGGVGLISGAGGGASGGASLPPTQNQPVYGPGYFNQVQQNYNSYLPQTPRDVATPLQQWYNRT
jgi:hypothetical protein